MAKFTPWFPAHVKPVRKGVYQRKGYLGRYSFWDGKKWCMGFDVLCQQDVKESKQKASIEQSLPWRGLAKNPNA